MGKFKLSLDTSQSHRVIFVVSWLYVAAILVEIGGVSELVADQLLILGTAVGGLILLVGGLLVKKQGSSRLFSSLGALLILFSAAIFSLDPAVSASAGIWWYIVAFALSITSVLYGLSVIIALLAFIGLFLSDGGSFDSALLTTTLATLATVFGGIIASSLSGSGKKTAAIAVSDQLKPEMLLGSIADGIIVVDPQKQIQVFNQAAAEITGWPVEDVGGLDFRSVLKLIEEDGDNIPDNANPFMAVINGSDTVKDNNALLATKSRKTVNLSLIVSPIKNEEGKVAAAVGIFRDVTQERNEEKQRAEFISTASHEMRTPVAAIEGYLALAMNDKVSKIDSKARDYLEKAHSSTQHLGKLFQDLLTAAKSEDGRLSNHPQVVEVNAFIDEVVEAAKFAAEKQGLLLKDDTKGEDSELGSDHVRPVAYIHVDPDRLREVITNLTDNAIKYTEEGKVTVGLHVDEKEVIVQIEDTGQGIPKEDIPHLFQKFYRVDNTATRQVGGTGLGLFISRKIVELYKGRIWAESELGEGSTFYVAIPRISAEEAQKLQQQEAATTRVPDA